MSPLALKRKAEEGVLIYKEDELGITESGEGMQFVSLESFLYSSRPSYGLEQGHGDSRELRIDWRLGDLVKRQDRIELASVHRLNEVK